MPWKNKPTQGARLTVLCRGCLLSAARSLWLSHWQTPRRVSMSRRYWESSPGAPILGGGDIRRSPSLEQKSPNPGMERGHVAPVPISVGNFYSFLIKKKKTLLRYNSHTIQFTHLKCIIQWLFLSHIHREKCNHHHFFYVYVLRRSVMSDSLRPHGL